MNFLTETVGKFGSRVGHVAWETGRHSQTVLETPLCLLYTKNGSIPHLTHEVLEYGSLIRPLQPIHLTLPTVIANYEALEAFKRGAATFVGFDGHFSYVSVQDCADTIKSGFNDKTGVAIWSRGGNKKVNAEHFMAVQEALRPDWFQALSDSDTNAESSPKRVKRSVDRTLDNLDRCLERRNESDTLKNSGIFGNIEGGFNLNERLRSTRETITRPVDGFIIEGFNDVKGRPIISQSTFEDMKPILLEVLKLLPSDKPRLMHGTWDPHQLLYLIKIGIDIFDTSYPYVITEKGCALTFSFEYKSVEDDEIKKFGQKSLEVETFKTIEYEIDLNDEKFKDDLTPLLHDCECYACKNHTKAYIHHLLVTSELLARVLLMMHNLHHYQSFFEAIREAIATDKLQELQIAVLGR